MTLYNLLNKLEMFIILNPFEWTIFLVFICLLIGSYFEHLVGWWKPIEEENENDN